jgi:membrane protein implicated in regulation of membrane protease activity
LHHDQDGIATAKPGLRGHAGANPRRPMFTMVGIAIVLAIALAIALALAAARWAVSATSWGSASGSSGMLPTVGSVALLLGLLAAATGAARRFLHRRTLRQSRATRTAEFNSRVAELRRDPATCRYASLIEVGEAWSDEQIAYDRDPSALATCIHLQAIERVMRERGIALRLRRGLNVEAECRVAPSRLERRCRPSPSVIYTEYYESDGLERGEPVAALCCPECQSRIALVHPDRAAVDTTWFPGAQVVRDE